MRRKNFSLPNDQKKFSAGQPAANFSTAEQLAAEPAGSVPKESIPSRTPPLAGPPPTQQTEAATKPKPQQPAVESASKSPQPRIGGLNGWLLAPSEPKPESCVTGQISNRRDGGGVGGVLTPRQYRELAAVFELRELGRQKRERPAKKKRLAKKKQPAAPVVLNLQITLDESQSAKLAKIFSTIANSQILSGSFSNSKELAKTCR
ncbi:MAG: hypothetical protein KF851_03220 [Pirellulaceae bacterium]|nr:hypothetical protein [Pirellulaceae bacterium]